MLLIQNLTVPECQCVAKGLQGVTGFSIFEVLCLGDAEKGMDSDSPVSRESCSYYVFVIRRYKIEREPHGFWNIYFDSSLRNRMKPSLFRTCKTNVSYGVI